MVVRLYSVYISVYIIEYMLHNISWKFGKNRSKTQVYEVACPDENCKYYCLTGQGNVIGKRTHPSCGKRLENTFARVVAKYSVIVQVLFITTFVKTIPLSALKIAMKGTSIGAIAD